MGLQGFVGQAVIRHLRAQGVARPGGPRAGGVGERHNQQGSQHCAGHQQNADVLGHNPASRHFTKQLLAYGNEKLYKIRKFKRSPVKT
jgi:hypothetical protein